MNKIIDLRTASFDVANLQITRRAMTRAAYLHGLIRPGVCDYVRERVKSLLLERGIVAVDPELDLRAQRLERMDTQEAAYMLSGMAARCDYIISLPTFGEPLEPTGLTELTTRELRQLGMTTYLWPDYGPGGPSMNPGYLESREQEALSRIAQWQPDPVGFAGVVTSNPAACSHGGAMPMQAAVGTTREALGRDAEFIDRARRKRQFDRQAGAGEKGPVESTGQLGFGESRQVG